MAVAVGVFAGCTPAIGFHGWVAVGAATILRLNRLYAFVGSRVSAFFILPFIIIAEIQSSHYVRTHTWVALSWQHASEEGFALFGDWILGTFLVGIPLAIVLGVLAYAWGMRRASAKAGQALAESSTIARK